MSNPSISADKTPWYQWDTGLTVTVSGGEMNECHFANRKQGTAYVQSVINGIARVPDELLQVAAPIKAYGYVSDGAGGQTYVEQTFEVIARNIPAGYTYTKTAQKTIRDAEAARDEAVKAAKDAKASELAADDSAVESSNSAQSAGESASAAATSASNAAKSAADAAKSASDAKAAASKTVEDASKLLKTYTDNAKTSADNAATSASNAADAASAASGSASAAEQSATDSNSAKVAAQTAKDEAATSASNAESSATAAAKSASDAAASVGAINVIAPKTVETAAVATGTDSVAIGSGSSASKANEFSIGNDAMTREITHVSTPIADTSAATKKYTDDNDTKTLSESKKYTDDNTSNALVGNVSGNLLHVEDAWPGKLLGLTIDGAYKQDGTPSPDNPVPITVIENPVLRVTGRNVFRLKPNLEELTTNGMTFTPTGDGGIHIKGTATDTAFYNLDFGGVSYSLVPFIGQRLYYKIPELRVGYWNVNGNQGSIDSGDAVPNTARVWRSFLQVNAGVTVDKTVYPYVTIGRDDGYAPYTSATLPITLPAEHPYLAALPDGTHDEIVIDKDGNASLVARVGKSIIPDGQNKWGQGYTWHGFPEDGAKSTSGGIGVLSDKLLYSKAVDIYKGNAIGISIGDIFLSDVVSTCVFIGDNDIANIIGSTIYYKLATPVTYHLGKLDIPSLPETISNVWTDAELTTNMSMTYKRDINIAFDNLVQAVVAAAAGE